MREYVAPDTTLNGAGALALPASVPVPALARFRHYLNLRRSLPRLERLTRRFRFGTMREVLEGQGYGDYFERGQLDSSVEP